MKDLLESYYKGFSQKKGWEDTIADDFQFVGGDMTKSEPLKGKQAYIEVIKRFSQVFKSMHVVKTIVDGDQACVIGNYDFTFPSGREVNGNVAEIWTAKKGKLQSLAIYFDTLTFANNAK